MAKRVPDAANRTKDEFPTQPIDAQEYSVRAGSGAAEAPGICELRIQSGVINEWFSNLEVAESQIPLDHSGHPHNGVRATGQWSTDAGSRPWRIHFRSVGKPPPTQKVIRHPIQPPQLDRTHRHGD